MVILLYNQINILQQFNENEGELERELSLLIHSQSMYVWDCISWMFKTLKLDNNNHSDAREWIFSGHTKLFFISNAVPDFSANDFCCGRIKIRFKHRISSASPKCMQIEEPISFRQLFQHKHRPATTVAVCCGMLKPRWCCRCCCRFFLFACFN